MKFKDIYTKYNELGVLTDAELDFLVGEYLKLDNAVRDKICFLGYPTVGVVGIELRRLQDIKSSRAHGSREQ